MVASFDNRKDAGALRTIGEVSEALGIKPHVLRYWEQQFPMLKPLKRSGGRRYYRAEDIELLETIDRLVNRDGYTLKGAKAAIPQLRNQDRPPLAQQHGVAVSARTEAEKTSILPQLRKIRARLADALQA